MEETIKATRESIKATRESVKSSTHLISAASAVEVGSKFQDVLARQLVELRERLTSELNDAFAALGIGISVQLEELLCALPPLRQPRLAEDVQVPTMASVSSLASLGSPGAEDPKARRPPQPAGPKSAPQRDALADQLPPIAPPPLVSAPPPPGAMCQVASMPSSVGVESLEVMATRVGLDSLEVMATNGGPGSPTGVRNQSSLAGRTGSPRSPTSGCRNDTCTEVPEAKQAGTSPKNSLNGCDHQEFFASCQEIVFPPALPPAEPMGVKRRTVQWHDSVLKAEAEERRRSVVAGKRTSLYKCQSYSAICNLPEGAAEKVSATPVPATPPAAAYAMVPQQLPSPQSRPSCNKWQRPSLGTTGLSTNRRSMVQGKEEPRQQQRMSELHGQLVLQQQNQLRRHRKNSDTQHHFTTILPGAAPDDSATLQGHGEVWLTNGPPSPVSSQTAAPMQRNSMLDCVTGEDSGHVGAFDSEVRFSVSMARHRSTESSGCGGGAGRVKHFGSTDSGYEQAHPQKGASVISEEEPENLEVLLVWADTRRKTASVNTLRAMAFHDMKMAHDFSQQSEELLKREDQRCLSVFQRMVVDPNSKRRLMWDLIGFFFVLYDIWMVPLSAFGISNGNFVGWFMRIYWTIDIPSQFLTGYLLGDGDVETDLRFVARHYAHTWMAIDVMIVSVDWLDVVLSSLNGQAVSTARMGKIMRVMRMIRVVRILRVAKLPIIQGTWLEGYIRSERVMLVASMCKTMWIIVILLHFIACSWWGIGNLEYEDRAWVTTQDFQYRDFSWQYTSSFHWSLAQFAGDMEVDPANVLERSFAILVLLFAFVVSALFVSSITSSMTRLQMIVGNKTTMFSELKQYLTDNNISPRLVARVSRNAHRAYQEYQRTTPEAEIELLKLVSEPLRVELHFEVHSPVLLTNPFFMKYGELNPAALRRVCHAAINISFLSVGDVVFVSGEAPRIPQMWFVLNGALSYKNDHEQEKKIIGPALCRASKFSGEGRGSLRRSMMQNGNPGCWVSEAVLWCAWIHTGVLRAEMDCRLLGLDALTFQAIAPQFASDDCLVSKYAYKYIERLNKNLHSSHLSDLDEDGISETATDHIFEIHRRRTQAEDDNMKRSIFATLHRSASNIFHLERQSEISMMSASQGSDMG